MENIEEIKKTIKRRINEDNLTEITDKTLNFLTTLSMYNINECDIGVMHALVIATACCTPEKYSNKTISDAFLIKAGMVFTEETVKKARIAFQKRGGGR